MTQVYDEPMGRMGQGVKTLDGVDYYVGYSFTLSVVGVEGGATFFGRLSAARQPYEPECGRKERFRGSRAQTGSRNMAATRFSDSATPTCVKIESRPKYTTTSGLTPTTFFANFSENN